VSAARVAHLGALPADPATAFAWLTRQGAQGRLLPPWAGIDLRRASAGGVADGAQTGFRLRLGPLTRPFVVAHRVEATARTIVDRQVTGPFSSWEHRSTVRERNNGSELDEAFDWTLPMGVLGAVADQWVLGRLERILRYRHAVLRDDLALQRVRPLPGGRRIAVTGASGLVGTALTAFLQAAGHTVVPVVRRAPREGEIGWDPAAGRLASHDLEGVHAVVHLAGANLAGRRWSAAYKRELWDSRIDGTRLLAETLSQLATPPSVLVSASAVGYYGNRGDEILTEESGPGTGFLAELCCAWEGATAPAAAAGVRVVHLRSGMILSPAGGVLAKMLPAFCAGIGGRLGDGRQWVSWISLDDALGAIYWALADIDLSGGVNATGPEPVTNRTLTATLGRVLRRPTLGPPLPAVALRMAFGEMADETALASNRVLPEVLTAAGYPFRHGTVETALAHVLGRG